jgi:hypothetical protein
MLICLIVDFYAQRISRLIHGNGLVEDLTLAELE